MTAVIIVVIRFSLHEDTSILALVCVFRTHISLSFSIVRYRRHDVVLARDYIDVVLINALVRDVSEDSFDVIVINDGDTERSRKKIDVFLLALELRDAFLNDC